MVIHTSFLSVALALMLIMYLAYKPNCNALSLLQRLTNIDGENSTEQISTSGMGNSFAEMSPTDFTPLDAKTCSANATLLHNIKVLTEIRKVGETCRQYCRNDGSGSIGRGRGSGVGGGDGGSGGRHHISSELGEFSRRLQLLHLTVEGLALMLDEAIERLEEPTARKLQFISMLMKKIPFQPNTASRHG